MRQTQLIESQLLRLGLLLLALAISAHAAAFCADGAGSPLSCVEMQRLVTKYFLAQHWDTALCLAHESSSFCPAAADDRAGRAGLWQMDLTQAIHLAECREQQRTADEQAACAAAWFGLSGGPDAAVFPAEAVARCVEGALVAGSCSMSSHTDNWSSSGGYSSASTASTYHAAPRPHAASASASSSTSSSATASGSSSRSSASSDSSGSSSTGAQSAPSRGGSGRVPHRRQR